MNTTEVIRRRISANWSDTRRPLAQEGIRGLVESATQAPSSYNIQHGRFGGGPR